MKHIFWAAALIALMAYIGSAVATLDSFVSAVGNGDAAALSDHVDFPAIRASLKEQMTSAMMTRLYQGMDKKEPGSTLGTGLAAAFAPVIINNMIDGLVTPAGLNKMFQGNLRLKDDANKNANFWRVVVHVSLVNPTRFKVSTEDGGSFIYSFEDWAWKLTDIRMPTKILDTLGSSKGGN